ncbi:MAG: patatin family protein [Propionibacteriaceae bacterium]|jgi:predicted patatin/cPLA2 family phospholipase|nr:patatin family protein [Propionibacteriaceae bacterium]
MSETLHSNIFDVALVLEGGQMRVSYTAPLIVKLIQEQLWFDYVCGTSAGSSHAVNYLSRDAERARKSFVEFCGDPKIGGWLGYFKGKARFDAEYVYEHTAGPNDAWPFDFATFRANPAQMRLATFDVAAGKEVWWTKDDCPTLADLMVRVRSSSAMPILMKPTFIDNRMYYDGGCGPNAGIPLPQAQRDDYRKFLIVLSQPRGFKKDSDGPDLAFKLWLRRHPHVVHGLLSRTERYDRIRAEIAELEASADAYVFYSDAIPYPSATQNVAQLAANYEAGTAQLEQEWPRLLEWLSPHIRGD